MKPVYFTLALFVGLTAFLSYDNGRLTDALTAARADLITAENSNRDLVASLKKQSAELTRLQALIDKSNEAADRAAEDTLGRLPDQLAEDHQAGTEPDDMNQWMEALLK